MESRKGADSLIAPLANATSARFILALVVSVALTLAGCGEDSDDEAGSTASVEQTEATSAVQAPSSSGRSAGSKSPDNGSASTEATSGSSGGKESPPITLPRGAPESGITPEQRETAKVASITLESPDTQPVSSGPEALPALYTCDGKDSWPTLRWKGVPAGTEELVLFTMSLAPIEGKVFFAWAVAGIDPNIEEIEAGRLPKGVVMGRNSLGQMGYSICPPSGQGENYFFALYALPQRLAARPGFDPHVLRKQVQDISRNVGLLAIFYSRS